MVGGQRTSGLTKNDATNIGCMETWKHAWNDARTCMEDGRKELDTLAPLCHVHARWHSNRTKPLHMTDKSDGGIT